ncbi:MAG: NAD(P)-binding domain-containing protein [Deinococcota bacterium]
MDIGIIGAGNIGSSLARLFAQAGYPVMISNSRGPETLQDLVAELGRGVQAGSVEDAAHFGEVVIEAIPFKHVRSLPVGALTGKILVTAANYYPNRDGQIDLNGKTHSELVAQVVSEARVVKAFNTIYYVHLQTQGDTSKPLAERRAIFMAGDDTDAKTVVRGLIQTIGFGAVDTGSLANSAVQQPGAAIYNQDLTVGEVQQQF